MSDRKHILFLMTDQHRLDHCSYHGRGRIQTPNFDRLAGSVGFTACATANPICTPARTALLAGKYTHQIGTAQMAGDLMLQHPTYLRALQQAGYWTAGVGKFHWMQTWPWDTPRGEGLDLVALTDRVKEYGLDYVWEVSGKQLAQRNYCEYAKYLDVKGLLDAYRDHVASRGTNTPLAAKTEFTGEPWPFEEADYVDIVTADHIIEAIRNRPADKPMFLFASFCGPHPPFDPPRRYLDRVPADEPWQPVAPSDDVTPEQGERLRRMARAYKAMIYCLDEQVGRVLDALEEDGIADETVILFTTDHGELLGDHGFVQKSEPFESSVTVPAAIRHPDHLDGRLYDTPVELTDLTATILDIAGLDPQDALSMRWPAFQNIVPCRSLMPIVRGETDRIRDYAFSECRNDWKMIRTDRYKYIRYLKYDQPGDRREAFYDLQADPDETDNRIADSALADEVALARARCDFVMDSTPPAQLSWAPLINDPNPNQQVH